MYMYVPLVCPVLGCDISLGALKTMKLVNLPIDQARSREPYMAIQWEGTEGYLMKIEDLGNSVSMHYWSR